MDLDLLGQPHHEAYEEYSPSYETATAPVSHISEPEHGYQEPTYSLPLFDPNDYSYQYSDDYYHEPETHSYSV